MLPEDTDWHADDGNEEVTHDFVNAIERSVDCVASASGDGTYPAPTGTTLPWGGGKIFAWQLNAGIAAGAKATVEATLDWRNRLIVVLGAGAYNAGGADKLPGKASYDGAGSMGFDFAWSTGVFWTHDGATDGDPPGVSAQYFTLDAGNAYLFADETDSYKLKLRNGTAATFYPFLLIWVSDQMPTRLP